MKSQVLPGAGTVREATRGGYLLLGLLCVALGFIGYIVPGMPGTVFFIVALWAFKRSSPRLEQWLLNHRLVGPTLRDWHETRSISKGTKAFAIAAIWVCIGVSIVLTSKPWLWALL